LSTDEPPGRARTAECVARSGDAEGIGLDNRLVEQVVQRLMDTRVLNARGSEKKSHNAPIGILPRGMFVVDVGGPDPHSLRVEDLAVEALGLSSPESALVRMSFERPRGNPLTRATNEEAASLLQ